MSMKALRNGCVVAKRGGGVGAFTLCVLGVAYVVGVLTVAWYMSGWMATWPGWALTK